MTTAFSLLGDHDLRSVLTAIKGGYATAPFSASQFLQTIHKAHAEPIANALQTLVDTGLNEEQLVAVFEMMLHDRQSRPREELPIDLVTSGPDAPGISNRDTSVVVRDLFKYATRSVLVVGYAVYQGQQVFEALAEQMRENPSLHVEMFLDCPRPDRDTSPAEVLVSRFAERFRTKQWPKGCRLPVVYYDPRSVSEEGRVRSSLHAKCVVVDGERVFVSSANFTDAGQRRNVEVGLRIDSEWLGKRITRHFQLLREDDQMLWAFGEEPSNAAE
jgi:hypothetical protein